MTHRQHSNILPLSKAITSINANKGGHWSFECCLPDTIQPYNVNSMPNGARYIAYRYEFDASIQRHYLRGIIGFSNSGRYRDPVVRLLKSWCPLSKDVTIKKVRDSAQIQRWIAACRKVETDKAWVLGEIPHQGQTIKQQEVKAWLDAEGLIYRYNCAFANTACVRYRPDFMFYSDTHVDVLECDEKQHSTYSREEEQKRMIQICQALGKATRFIRYNPDSLRDEHGKSLNIAPEIRKQALLEHLRSARQTPPQSLCEAIYLFYDGYRSDRADLHSLMVANESPNAKVFTGDSLRSETKRRKLSNRSMLANKMCIQFLLNPAPLGKIEFSWQDKVCIVHI